MNGTSATVRVDITRMAFPGRGVGTLPDGRIVFVPRVLPGESVDIRPVREHRRFVESDLVTVVSPSPLRVRPVCPLAADGSCPGCCYQHAPYASEVAWKHDQLGDLLRRVGRVASDVRLPPVASPREYAYRNKIVLHAGREGDRIVLGYVGSDNRTVVDVPRCALAADELNALLASLRAREPFMASLRADQSVTLRYTPADGALWWRGRSGDVPGVLTESCALGEVEVPRGSFHQVNTALADLLVAGVRDLVARLRPSRVVDLYGGTGLFALAALAAGVAQVIGVDSDPRAVRAAGRNAVRRGWGASARFVAAPAAEGLAQIERQDGTALIVDPPRAGLDEAVERAVVRLQPRDIVYVSCAPDTLARDVARLSAHGYTVRSSQVHDMFPRTPHFESMTWLARES